MVVHPSKDIIGTVSCELSGKRIALCVTGSVAAVKSPIVAREIMRRGAEVFTVLSESAQRIIHPDLMEWATGNPVVTRLTGKVEHIALAGECDGKVDLVLIAPATANTISKIAMGVDDTTVTSVASTAIGSQTPLLIAPAMHKSMYNHTILNENIQKLRNIGIDIIRPKIEEGKAKIADTEDIISAVTNKLVSTQDFKGKNFLVTAGPTIEYIDPVRIITNKSSGLMGAAIAEEARSRGANVTLIYGLCSTPKPSKMNVVNVETTDEMQKALLKKLEDEKVDIVIAAAAISDWTPTKPLKNKISTWEKQNLTLKLIATPKLIKDIKKHGKKIFLVAFRAEYNLSNKKLVEKGYEYLKKTKADLLVVNDVSRKGSGFRTKTNEVFIIDRENHVTHVPLSSKYKVAERILDIIRKNLD